MWALFFSLEDLFSLILWRTNSAVNYRRLDLVVQYAKFYRIRQGMVRIFLAAFYLHKFKASAFCAWLEQWGLTVSIAFFPVAEPSTPSVSFCFPAQVKLSEVHWNSLNFTESERQVLENLWSLLVVFFFLEFSTSDLSTLVLFNYGKAKLVPGSMW